MGEEDAKRFRSRAEHCRRLASATQDPEARRTLNEMADDLEAEADRLDADAANAALTIHPNQRDGC